MSRAIFATAPALLLLAASPASETLRPGLWKTTVAMNLAGADGAKVASPPGNGGVARSECVGSGRTIDQLFGEGLDNCTMRDLKASGGHLSFDAICTPDEDGFSMDLVGSGDYTPERVTLRFDGHAGDSDLKMSIAGRMTATRVGDCKLDQATPRQP